ncbi:hypothetical protein EVG20_g4843 [Dentipellis fragilis]|uniref:Uncharacterized protein n=1 Tax=Dentipellis fragilis TaxID=205917 RepID=A0A4Y9YXF3_9AGAM|nr:hypothetical protein EVG20_g4843 [Dentipellis fragilis]
MVRSQTTDVPCLREDVRPVGIMDEPERGCGTRYVDRHIQRDELAEASADQIDLSLPVTVGMRYGRRYVVSTCFRDALAG